MNRKERRAINRANATHSTGPVTADGKLASSANATTHGLTARKPYLPAEEADYKTFAAGRLTRLDPRCPAEHDLAATVVDLEWRLQRIPTLEARLFESEDEDAHKIVRSLDVLSRHEVRLRKLLDTVMTALYNTVVARRKQQAAKAQSAAAQENGFVLKPETNPDAGPDGFVPKPRSIAEQMADMHSFINRMHKAA